MKSLMKGFVPFVVAATALASVCFDSPAFADSFTVAFPVSRTQEQTMVEMFPLKSTDAAYGKIRGILSTLADPFSWIISLKEYQSFRIGSDGNLQVGLFISVEPKTGIHGGDELIEINGQRLDGIDSEAAAQRLRG